jgi:hypothetical protein
MNSAAARRSNVSPGLVLIAPEERFITRQTMVVHGGLTA